MTPDVGLLAKELAKLYRDEEKTDIQYEVAKSWQCVIHDQLREAGDAAIANPDRTDLAEAASILVGLQYVVIDEMHELEDRYMQHDGVRAAIAELAAMAGLTLADLNGWGFGDD